MKPSLEVLFEAMGGESQNYGSTISPHLPVLFLLARDMAPHGEIVEIGVGGGWSTIALMLAAYERGQTLTSYDIWEGCKEASSRSFEKVGLMQDDPRRASWKLKIGMGQNGVEDFADQSVALLFLDGNHGYPFVKRELDVWHKKMHPKGIICGHDYLPERVTEKEEYGVCRAVDEFVFKDNPGKYRMQISPYSWGLYILWPK